MGTSRSPPAPARRHRSATACPERLGEAALARVLERVERAANGPAERRTPLELEQRLRRTVGEPERRPGRQRQPGVKGAAARRADRRPLRPAPRARRGQREIEQPIDWCAKGGCHTASVAIATSLRLNGSAATARVSAGHVIRRDETDLVQIEGLVCLPVPDLTATARPGGRARDSVTGRPGPARGGMRPRTARRSPRGRPRRSRVAAIVPTGSSRTPSAPRTSGTSPVQAAQRRVHGPHAPHPGRRRAWSRTRRRSGSA